MLTLEELDEITSEYYDNELYENELFNFEAKIATSREIRDYTNERCFEYFKISNSMRLVKIRAKDRAEKMSCLIFEKINSEKSIFKLNSVLFERFKEIFCGFFLNIRRNDTQKLDRF